MSDMVCVVTGTGTYRYMKLEENFRSFREMHSQLLPQGREDVSTNYTAHCWAKDKVQLIVTTAAGDLLVCAMSGEFLIYVPGSPQGFRVDAVAPYSRGLILAGEQGFIWPFEQTSNEHEVYRPYQ